METPQRGERLSYKWVIMAICCLMVFTALGFCSSNKDLFLKPITKALDLQRSGFALGDTCRYIATAVVNLFFSALIVKWGAKKMAAYGFLALIAFCLIYSFAVDYWQFYIGGFFLGTGLAWCTTTLVGYVVAQWFTENRGTIMGVILASNGLGAAVFAPIVTPIIDADAFGYRTAYRVGAIMLAAVLVLILLFFRSAPEGVEPQKPTGRKKPSRGRSWSGIEFSQAKRRSYFYIAALGVFLTGAALQAISGIKSAHLSDVGLGDYKAVAASFYAVCLAAAKVLAGVSFDKLGLRVTIFVCDAAAVVAILLLALLSEASSLVVIFVCMAFLAFAMPLETIMLPLIVADMFGEKSFAKIMGLFVSICTAGYAVGAPITNRVYDVVGSYRPALFVMVGLMAVVTVTFQLILTVSGRERDKIIAAETANA
ncbi:MAG: MFS transporter [Oscillospiraceae bacterium]|nr:MFS transporter [Oscillospiraceae bacterium]